MKSSVRLDQTLQRLWTLPATLSVGAHRQCGCVLGRRELYKIQCAGKSGTADARPWDKSPKEKAKKENATPSPKKSGKSKATGLIVLNRLACISCQLSAVSNDCAMLEQGGCPARRAQSSSRVARRIQSARRRFFPRSRSLDDPMWASPL